MLAIFEIWTGLMWGIHDLVLFYDEVWVADVDELFLKFQEETEYNVFWSLKKIDDLKNYLSYEAW